MKTKLLLSLLVAIFGMLCTPASTATTTPSKTVQIFQRVSGGPIGEGIGEGKNSVTTPITCVIYQDGTCVYDPNIERVTSYEIWNGTARLGIYYNSYSFASDLFSFRGNLILVFNTATTSYSGKVYNY